MATHTSDPSELDYELDYELDAEGMPPPEKRQVGPTGRPWWFDPEAPISEGMLDALRPQAPESKVQQG